MSGTQKVLSASEPWAEYQLEDGTLLRFRLTACNFRKTGKTTDHGDPEYSFSHQMQCETIPKPVVESMWTVEQLAAMRQRAEQNGRPVMVFNKTEPDYMTELNADIVRNARKAASLPQDAG